LRLGWLTPDWPAPPGVRALATLRAGGVSTGRYASLNLAAHVGDDAVAVAENRAQLQAAVPLPSEPVWLDQVHGIRVVELESVARPGPADAAITRAAGRVCAVLTADCLPVLFASRDGAVVGAAHAGWRGLAAGVLEATVVALGVPATALIAWLGPAIGPRHFEVGAEVREAFLRDDAGAEEAFERNLRGRFQADLTQLARRRLARCGLMGIFGGTGCTYREAERFFSHRRDGITGRQATLIWREQVPLSP
jgi:YfiH family protein